MKKRTVHKEHTILLDKISGLLDKKENVILGYIFGSFISSRSFNDIDIGIYISDSNCEDALKAEMALEHECEKLIHIPVDVRILNRAPLAFVFNVIKDGMLIVDKNSDMRADFEGLICKKYFDFRHLRNEYLKEVANAPL